MKGTDILDRMNKVDLKYVREMDGDGVHAARLHRLRGLSVAAAACLVIAAAVPAIWWGASHRSAPIVPVDSDSVTEAPVNTTAAETEPLPEPVFEIENGLLVAYRGNDQVVNIPDEVMEIGSDVFAMCDTGEVKVVRLGANVEKIDSTAFVSLTNLESIEVSEDSEYYEICDGVLAARDGSIFFDVGAYKGASEQPKNSEEIFEILSKFETGKADIGTCRRFVMGRMTAEIIFEKAGDTRDDLEFVAYFTAMSAYGSRIEFDSPIYLNYGTQQVRMFNAGEVYLFVSDREFTYLFSPDGIIKKATHIVDSEAVESTGQTICDNYITFYTGDNGELRYKKSPEKYDTEGFLFDQIVALPLQCCVSADEFALEDGVVTIMDGEAVLIPERVYSAGELFDLQALFDQLDPGYDTLEEYIAENARKFPRARSLPLE